MLSSCLIAALIISSVHSFSSAEINQIKNSIPHINPKQFLLTNFNPNKATTLSSSQTLQGADTGSLTVSPSIIASDTQWMTVSWHNVSYTSKYDWIGLFNASAASETYAAPPIKYQYICPAFQSCSYPPASGALQFKILNRRTQYLFAYVTPSNPYREVKGISTVISYKSADLYQPMNVHIATCVNTARACMQIMWTQKEIISPMVKFGLSKDALTMHILARDTSILSAEDMCAQQYGLPAGTSGYFEMGYMITAYLFDLQSDTHYFYQLGEDTFGWTDIYNFTSNPQHGSVTKRGDIRMIIFGDMGNVAIDYSMHHSWDFGNQGEIYSINTSNTIALFTNGINEVTDAVIHIGDISYSVGFLAEWDDFFHQIEPVSCHIPWMTGVGNHEYSWTGEWKPPNTVVTADAYGNGDGGGECGVPYNFYFPFANANQNESRMNQFDPRVVQPWYYFDYGIVRTVIISTEHDFGTGSAQFQFINATLSGTDRSVFPWIFVAGHRPMYVNDDWDGDTSTAQYLRDSLEAVMSVNKVALGFWGHQHSYGRTCPVYKSECKSAGEATVHLIVGMAGYELSKSVSPMSYTVFQNNTIYGFVHLTVYNQTVMKGKFIDANTTETVDAFYVMNPYQEQ